MTRWVLHVDLDQFIAAVELLRRPELRGRPVVVGGDGDPTKRGVVATASYEARVYGVHSGLPLRTAARRCPQAVFLPVDRQAYETVSAKVMSTLRESDAVVEVVGWDEAFLAIDTDDPQAAARRIAERVRAATRLDCTVGIGVSELAATDPRDLAAHLGPVTGPWLVETARGLGNSAVTDAPYLARARSREITFQRDIGDWDQVRGQIVRLAQLVVADVASEQRAVSRVVVKVRYAPFTTRTHGEALAAPTLDAQIIERAALAALERLTSRRPVRLVGVRAEFARG